MLQQMRDKIQGWLTWLIVLVICVMFAMWGVSYYLTGMVSSKQVVAKVGSQEISQAEWDRAYQLAATHTPQSRSQALDNLIKQNILVQAAEAAGFSVSSQMVDETLYQLPVLQDQGKFSLQRYQLLLQNLGMTTDQLRQELRDNILIEQYRLGLVQSEFALPDEASQLSSLLTQQRSFRYLLFPSQQYLNQVKVTEAEAQYYYQQHQNNFMTPDEVKLDYIEISGTQAASIGDQLANLTFENPNSLTDTAKQLGLTVQSTAPFSKTGGIGIAKDPNVIRAAFSDSVLKQGNNSDVINLPGNAAVVVRVAQAYPAKPIAFADVQAKIVEILKQQAALKQAHAVAVQVMSEINQGTQKQAFAWQAVANVTRDDKTLSKELLQAVFLQPIPSVQPAISVVAVPEGYAVLQLTAVRRGAPDATTLASYQYVLKSLLASETYQVYYDDLKSRATIKVTAP